MERRLHYIDRGVKVEEITFADVLTHYQLKLTAAADEVETIKLQIKKAEGCIEMGWTGAAADACRRKLEDITGELGKTLNELSEALVKLSAIGENLDEDSPVSV